MKNIFVVLRQRLKLMDGRELLLIQINVPLFYAINYDAMRCICAIMDEHFSEIL